MFVTWIAISLVVAIGLCVILNCLEQIMLIDIEKMNLKKKAKKRNSVYRLSRFHGI